MTSVEPIKLPPSSGGYSNSKIIKAGNGVFYTGMTREDAAMIGRDKCLLRRDFGNLDKNGDNVLTNDEIMLERERQAHVAIYDAIICGLFALDDVISIIKGPSSFFNFLFGALFTGCAIDSLNKKKKLEAANEQLRQQLRVEV